MTLSCLSAVVIDDAKKLVLPLLGGVLVLAGDAEDVLGDLQVNSEVDRLHNLLATASGAVVHKPFQVKDQDGWKVLKTEVPAGLHLLPGLRADVAVQLLAREVLKQRLLHTADHLVLDVELESEERLQSRACLPALGFH